MCFRPQGEMLDAINSCRNKYPYPSFGMSLGHAYVLQYPGTGKLFEIGKYFQRKNFDKKDGGEKTEPKADYYRTNFNIKMIPSLILGLTAMYDHIMEKLDVEGQERDISEHHPSTHVNEKDDNVGKEFLDQIQKTSGAFIFPSN